MYTYIYIYILFSCLQYIFRCGIKTYYPKKAYPHFTCTKHVPIKAESQHLLSWKRNPSTDVNYVSDTNWPIALIILKNAFLNSLKTFLMNFKSSCCLLK